MDGRPPLSVLALLVLVFAWAMVAGMWAQIESADSARPVRVAVTMAAPADIGRVRLIVATLAGEEVEVAAARVRKRGATSVATFEVDGVWVRDLMLALPADALEALETVEIAIGDVSARAGGDALLEAWRPVERAPWQSEAAPEKAFLRLPDGVRSAGSRLPAGRGLRNWPGDADFAARAALVAATITAGAFLLYLLGRGLAPSRRPGAIAAVGFGLGRDDNGPSAPGTRPRPALWLLFGMAVMAAVGVLLESRDPYYFTQDDNFAQFLPMILHGCSVLAEGAFPDFNPFQFMGTPTASVGVYALTYPPTWLSCAIAERILGAPAAAIEVFAFLHLAAGYGAAFWAGRAAGLRPALACAVALSFALSGFFLIGGRSWYYMLPVALWLPLMVVAVEKLRRGPVGLGWALLTGLSVGAFFHAGNAQMWSYAIVLTALALALSWLAGEVPLRRLAWAAAAFLVAAAVAAPLLLSQLSFAAGVERQGGGGLGILGGLAAMVLPYPLVRAEHPNGWGNLDLEFMGHFYYAGTVLVGAGLAALLGLAALALAGRLPRRALASNLWLICGTAALLLALGNYAPLWGALSALPGFSKFNHPFKFLPFVVLFLCLGGAGVLENLLRQGRLKAGYGGAIAALTGALVLFHAAQARPSFYTYSEDPYPPLPRELRQILSGDGSVAAGRVLPISPKQTVATGYVASLQHNFPSLYRISSLEGYDTLVLNTMENRNRAVRLLEAPVAAARAYGVRWLVYFDPGIVTRARRPGKERLNDQQRFLHAALAPHGTARVTRPHFQLIELPDASPLAFVEGAPERPLALAYEGGAVRVELDDEAVGAPVVLNFLARPATRVLADGEPVSTTADAWGRVVVTPPAGTRTLLLGYAPPWKKGLTAALILGLAALALLAWLHRARRP